MMADVELNIRDGAKATLTGYVNKLTANNKYFRQLVDRSDAYLPIVERIFSEEGLPEDFKYLVIQESSLVSNQVSSSNAVGYWQFKKEINSFEEHFALFGTFCVHVWISIILIFFQKHFITLIIG